MSTVLFKRGTETEMNNTPITDGLVYFCTSNNKIYMDNESTRLQYGGGTTLISDASQASVANVFNSNASLQLFLQKTTVVDTKSAAMSVTQSHIPLGCLAFKEAIGTNDYSAIGNGTISGALTNLNQRTNTASTNISSITNQLKANNTSIYMDYHDGKYGYNTSANRGVGTFHPFNSGAATITYFGQSGTYTVPESGKLYMFLTALIESVEWYGTGGVTVTRSTTIRILKNNIQVAIAEATININDRNNYIDVRRNSTFVEVDKGDIITIQTSTGGTEGNLTDVFFALV